MQSIYESIKSEPFKIPEDDGNDLMLTFFNPDKEGWLWKQGRIYDIVQQSFCRNKTTYQGTFLAILVYSCL